MHLLYHNFCGLGAWAGLSWVPCFRISSRAAVRVSSRAAVTSSCASFKVLSVVIGRIQFIWGVGLRTSVPCWLVGSCEHLSCFSCIWLFVSLWTVAHQAPLSKGVSRQECWNGLPFPSPGDLPDPRIKPESRTLQADIKFLSTWACPG